MTRLAIFDCDGTLVHSAGTIWRALDATLLEPLRRAIGALVPDAVVVSGDLTQRAPLRS